MIFKGIYEFRGYKSTSVTKDDGTTKENFYTNIEDENGENCKFYTNLSKESPYKLNELEKGEQYHFLFEYNTKYGSMMIVGVECL